MPKLNPSKRRKFLREKLYQEQNGICYWCERQTILQDFPAFSDGPPNPLIATLDHLYHKCHPLRYVDNIKKHVMACYECNQERSIRQKGNHVFVGSPKSDSCKL